MIGDSNRWPAMAATLVIGFFLVVASTTVFGWFQIYSLKVRPLVALVVWAGFSLPLIGGGLVVILLAYLADLVSGGMVGLQIISMVVVFLAGGLAGRRLEITAWPLQVAAVFMLSLLYQLVFWGALNLAPRLHIQPSNFPWMIPPQALLDAAVAPLFIFMVNLLVRWLAAFWRRMDTRQGGRAA